MFKPLKDRVLIRPYAEIETTLYRPNRERPTLGVVEAIASGPINIRNGEIIPLELKVGDEVIFSKHAGVEYKFDGVNYLVMQQRDVYAVILP